MIDIDPAHRKLVESILRREIPDLEVRVFGSRVLGKSKPYSDLDLVVIGARQLPRYTLYRLRDEFEESELPFRIDIVDWHRLSAEFQNAISPQSEVIYSGIPQ